MSPAHADRRTRIVRCLAALLGVAACLICAAGCTRFAENLVQDETGFDGAVTVLEAHEDGPYAVVSVRVPYLNIYGEPVEGRARLVMHHNRIGQQSPTPAFCHVHYEMSVDGAKKWAERGWAVFCAFYNEEAPIAVSPGDGNNLARAILQWARRLPFIDGVRMHLDGGSQGGYMALAMSAEMFPVTSATADAPVVNWAYNFSYFEANRALVSGFASPLESPLPIFASVLQLADMAYQHFPADLSSDTWHRISPIAETSRITHPALITFTTGDMLVPMEQMTRKHLAPHDPTKFPPGYVRDFDILTPNENAHIPFDEILPPEAVYFHVEPLQEHSYLVTTAMRLGRELRPDQGPELLDKPWSKDHQWNLLCLDEGPPEPFSDHFTRAWNMSPDSFTAYYQGAPVPPELLNDEKLERLLERYARIPGNAPLLDNGNPVNRYNHPKAEQKDVLSGLLRYAELGPNHEARLKALYTESQSTLLGPDISATSLRRLLTDLAS